MIRCEKCGTTLQDSDVVYWKCPECDETFKTDLVKLQGISKLKSKNENANKFLLKCSSCGKGLDDGNEKIICKCSTCESVITGNLKFFTSENVENTSSNAVESINPSTRLVKCPECGKEISKKAKKCVHCGKILNENPSAKLYCSDCGKEIPAKATECPNCGCPVEDDAEAVSTKTQSSNKIKKSMKNFLIPTFKNVSPQQKKKRIGIIVGILTFIIISEILYFFFSPHTVEWFCYHNIYASTCTEPQYCLRCGKTWGDPNGHNWEEATCTNPKTCTVCGAIEGSANGHNWKEATCTDPKTCSVCGITEGSAKGHNWSNATCTTPKKCKDCGMIEGTMLGHNVKDYICTRCGISIVNKDNVPKILDITSMTYEINSVGGIDWYITFKNKSSTKTINYITIELKFFNAVGDVLHDDISNKTSVSLVFTGPLKPGKTSSSTYWRACFYNATFCGTIGIKEIKIEYSDGTTLILDEDIARYAVVAWR